MSKIEWTEQTWNPVTGCVKVSPGYENGFALSLLPERLGQQRNKKANGRELGGRVWDMIPAVVV